jgi:hypothetical protein
LNGITIKREHRLVNKSDNNIRILYSAPGTLILEAENFPSQILLAKYWNNTIVAAVEPVIRDILKSILLDKDATGRSSIFLIDGL